jgi:hypothetical protein
MALMGLSGPVAPRKEMISLTFLFAAYFLLSAGALWLGAW